MTLMIAVCVASKNESGESTAGARVFFKIDVNVEKCHQW